MKGIHVGGSSTGLNDEETTSASVQIIAGGSKKKQKGIDRISPMRNGSDRNSGLHPGNPELRDHAAKRDY